MGEDPAELLAAGQAFADLSSWRKIAVSGRDAFEWINDLVSADISDVAPGRARHSLLLSRTGAIRAAFTVSSWSGELLLIQDPAQPSIAGLLAPYVLSSDVTMQDRSREVSAFAIPGQKAPIDVPDGDISSPSCLGPGGVDIFCSPDDRDRVFDTLSKTLSPASEDDIERFRVMHGLPRLGVDVQDGDLPQESLLSGWVSREKGCFVGQEAVAKLDSLGRPRRVLVMFSSHDDVAAGDPVLADGDEVGRVTSATRAGTETQGLARITWAAREQNLFTPRGSNLVPRVVPA
jgi:folate-binding protein YgfZ